MYLYQIKAVCIKLKAMNALLSPWRTSEVYISSYDRLKYGLHLDEICLHFSLG